MKKLLPSKLWFSKFVPPRLLPWVKRVDQALGVVMGRVRTRQQPRNPWTHHHLAKVWVEQEQWQAAVEASQQAIALDPTCPWFYQTLGDAYSGLGLWEQAITTIRTGLELDAELSWLHCALGKVYLGQEQWSEAIQAFQEAIRLDSSVSWFHHHLGESLVKSGQWQAAVAPLETAMELEPNFPWSAYYLGEALLAQAEITAAIAVYQRVVRQRPDLDYLRACLEYAQHLQTQEQRIQAYCQQVRSQGPDPERLRILMLTPYPTYPPKVGAITRMFHEMEALGQRHALVVVSFIFSKEDYRLEADLERYCELGITVMLGDAPPRQPNQPKLIHRYSSERMRKLLRLLQPAQFDLFLCDFIYMAQYRELFPDLYGVLSEHNIESQLLKRCAALEQNPQKLEQLAQQTAAVQAFVASEREAELLVAFEDQYWSKFNLRLVVSQSDRQELQQRCTQGQTLVIHNGIDTQNITLLQPPAQPPAPQPPTILFIGTMSYYPNIDGVCYFTESILPIIWKHQPNIHFCIAGADPPQSILDLSQDARIAVIANPENMSEVAQTCQITVVPLRIGGGTRIKILHSMAMGLPVISTSLGCEGLLVVDGVNLLVRDQPEDFAVAVVKLLSDPELQQILRKSGRALVENHYDWRNIFQGAERAIVESYRAWQIVP